MPSLGIVASAHVDAVSYSHAWFGATPTAANDATAYQMGAVITLSAPTTLVGVRIWNPGLIAPQGGQNRSATLWSATSAAGASPTVRATADLPDLMTAGWTEHLFGTPYAGSTSAYYFVTYFVDGGTGLANADYGAVTNGLLSAVTSGPIQFESGGGRYATTSTPGTTIPTTNSNAFFGVDILYS